MTRKDRFPSLIASAVAANTGGSASVPSSTSGDTRPSHRWCPRIDDMVARNAGWQYAATSGARRTSRMTMGSSNPTSPCSDRHKWVNAATLLTPRTTVVPGSPKWRTVTVTARPIRSDPHEAVARLADRRASRLRYDNNGTFGVAEQPRGGRAEQPSQPGHMVRSDHEQIGMPRCTREA